MRPVAPLAVLLGLVLGLAALATSVGAQGWYVRGDFYCADSLNDPGDVNGCWGWNATCELWDDGLHGDGAEGDGILGAYVPCTAEAGRHQFKVAKNDWSLSYPSVPFDPLANAYVWVSGPGDLVHVRFDTRFLLEGWQPYGPAVAVDQPMPEGTVLEVIGSAPETGAWIEGVALAHEGARWQRVIRIAVPGTYEFKLRAVGTWSVVAFGYDYNNPSSRNVFYTTELPDTDVLFQYDEGTGRVRAIELGQVPTNRGSWGGLKARYR